MNLLRRDGPRQKRKIFNIHAYCGANGGGKSTAMLWDTLPSLEDGRPVLSTVRLLDYKNPRPCDDPACKHPEHSSTNDDGTPAVVTHLAAHPNWIPFTNFQQMLDIEHGDILADEVTGVASAYDGSALPSVIINRLMQLRRRDVVFRWSAPVYGKAQKSIRDVTQAVTFCTGSFPKRAYDEDGKLLSWRQNRLFRWLTYDAREVDEMNLSKASRASVEVFDVHLGPGSPAFAAFDTYDQVLSLQHVSESGRCMVCDGRRTAPSCTCPDYVETKQAAKAAAGGAGPRARSAARVRGASTSDGLSGGSGTPEFGAVEGGAVGVTELLPVVSGANASGPRRAAVLSA